MGRRPVRLAPELGTIVMGVSDVAAGIAVVALALAVLRLVAIICAGTAAGAVFGLPNEINRAAL